MIVIDRKGKQFMEHNLKIDSFCITTAQYDNLPKGSFVQVKDISGGLSATVKILFHSTVMKANNLSHLGHDDSGKWATNDHYLINKVSLRRIPWHKNIGRTIKYRDKSYGIVYFDEKPDISYIYYAINLTHPSPKGVDNDIYKLAGYFPNLKGRWFEEEEVNTELVFTPTSEEKKQIISVEDKSIIIIRKKIELFD